MYNHIGGNPSSGKGYMEECRPDYEEIYKQKLKELDIIKNFRGAFRSFIDVVGYDSFINHRTGENNAAALLGSVEFDIMKREKQLEALEEKISK